MGNLLALALPPAWLFAGAHVKLDGSDEPFFVVSEVYGYDRPDGALRGLAMLLVPSLLGLTCFGYEPWGKLKPYNANKGGSDGERTCVCSERKRTKANKRLRKEKPKGAHDDC